MKRDRELKEAIIQYIKKSYEQNRKAPSLRKILKHLKKEKLGSSDFYRIFPKGIQEACVSAAVPAPEDRIKRTMKASKVMREKKQDERKTSVVEDSVVKKHRTEELKFKRRDDLARARLEAQNGARKAKLSALKREAELDPKKIPAYLEALDLEGLTPYELSKSVREFKEGQGGLAKNTKDQRMGRHEVRVM